MPGRILFAIRDPGARNQPGLAKAIQVARARGAALELFHALTDVLMIELGDSGDDTLERLRARVENEAREPLERLCAAARKHGVETVCSVEWDYPPHEAIVRRATATGAELIIAECHRGGRTQPWLIHLTDWELLRMSPVPVLLLKNPRPYRRPLVLAAVDPAHAHAKPSQLDERILSAARGVSQELRGALHVMHANHPSIVGLDATAASRRASTSWSTMSYQELAEQEREAFENFRVGAGIARTRAHLVDGNPAAAIPRLAKRLKAGIVVMGAVSRSGFGRVFIGNTAERILGALPCDVLVVKPAAAPPPA